jgi:hypothetical protein
MEAVKEGLPKVYDQLMSLGALTLLIGTYFLAGLLIIRRLRK